MKYSNEKIYLTTEQPTPKNRFHRLWWDSIIPHKVMYFETCIIYYGENISCYLQYKVWHMTTYMCRTGSTEIFSSASRSKIQFQWHPVGSLVTTATGVNSRAASAGVCQTEAVFHYQTNLDITIQPEVVIAHEAEIIRKVRSGTGMFWTEV